MTAPFHRVDTSRLIRGAARILYAPITQAKPQKIEDVIFLSAGASEVQTITGSATGGTFTASFGGYTTPAQPYNVSPATLQAALEALPSIGTGNVTVAGTAGTSYDITFGGVLAAQGVETIVIDGTALTGGTATIAVTTPGQGKYDAKPGWFELGATREGLSISVNNSEDAFDIDQVQGDIGSAPTAWECSVSTRLAEMTLERLQFVWEGSDIVVDSTPDIPEREIGFAGATSYTERRLAVLFKREVPGYPDGLIRAYFFHKVVRAPQEGTIEHNKGGDAQSVQAQLKALADPTVPDPKKQFFIIRDQEPTAA